jgi:hypothetical protein
VWPEGLDTFKNPMYLRLSGLGSVPLNYQAMEDEMGRACNTNGEKNVCGILVGNQEM